MSFAHHEVLLMLAGLVPALILFLWWSWRTRRRLISQFVPPRLQATLTVGLSPRRARWRAALLIAGLSALVVALARPRSGYGQVEVKQRGLDIVIAIDTSRSMLAEDAGPGVSRLQRSKLAALDLARQARTDRVGLIAFAGSAFLQCPLTIDDEAFRQSVEALDTGIIQQGGTALGPAIQTALDAFGTERENVRVLVMFTDGEEHEAGAGQAADRAAARGLRIYTVGVGSQNGELIRVRDAQGGTSFLKDEQGNVVKSTLNDALLRDVATRTGGFYLPLQGARAMAELYARGLEPLPRADLASRVFEQFNERFQWPLGLALLILIWETILPERARRHGPARAVKLAHPTFGTAATLAFLGLAGALLASPRALASPASAYELFQKGDFGESQKEYERLSRNRPKDARYRFNAGAAAYKAGEFDAASQHFREALASPDLQLQHDAFYNLGNAQYRVGETASDPKQRQSAWTQSVQSYEAALKLAAEDPRTSENLAYVRKQLEALKQQQQQQQQQGQNQEDQKEEKEQKEQDGQKNQDQKDQAQKNKDQDQKSQDQKDQAQKDKDKQDPAQKDQAQKDQAQKDKEQAEGQDSQPKEEPGSEESKQEPTPPKPKPGDQGDPKPASQPKEAQEGHAPEQQGGEMEAKEGQMTPQQAVRLLDAAKGEEKLVPLSKKRARARVFKDW